MPKGGPGIPKSPEHKAKIGDANRKKAQDPEIRKKLSQRLKGRIVTWGYKLRKPKTEKKCPICNKIFLVSPCHLDQKYCSTKCSGIAKKGKHPSDAAKKKMSDFQKKRYEDPEERKKQSLKTKGRKLPKEQADRLAELNRKKAKDPKFLETLSKALKGKKKSDAYRENIRGEKNHQWKGGVTLLYKAIRDSIKYSEWRQSVYERDNFCDWFSGVKGNGNLCAHHWTPFNTLIRDNNIKTFEQAMECEALWDVNNGVTMFKTSHEAYHSMWGNDTHPNGRRTKNEPSRFDNP